ncbi:LAGLIDADG family homing endonuclease [Streptomyces sp. NPDC046942]|uniref:LAGLIDADG family homing endonuclease n=1 Tax=Streptomyces sp. NPDC046942 TaxID=3155137 RepID=UPI0033E0B5A9
MGMESRGGIAEGSRVWLPDGSVREIEEVVARRLSVLSFNKKWDTRPVRYGANQGPRDHSVGELIPVTPDAWRDSATREVRRIGFVSGRKIEAALDQRWVTQRRMGRQAWEWKRTDALVPGDRVPFSLAASYFGTEGLGREGYFVGAMLGDGGMTSCTPEFHGDPLGGAVQFMREFAIVHGCGVLEIPQGEIVRLRFPFRLGQRNPLTECLRRFKVWGQRCDEKRLPDVPLSRDFWVGCLSGLIDTDGCVRERVNSRGTLHGSVEFATVSPVLATQVSDGLLRLGIANRVRVDQRRQRGPFDQWLRSRESTTDPYRGGFTGNRARPSRGHPRSPYRVQGIQVEATCACSGACCSSVQ